MESSDTIAAISTPLGVGGIGIIRISGSESKKIGRRIFQPAKKGFKDFKPYVLHHGWIKNKKGELIDEVLISFMPGPGSYTGEDVVEINCHGGPAVVQLVLEVVLEEGARLAKPGEFTLRAFLNGRIDLSRAEAISEMVSAHSSLFVKLSSSKLSGRLKEKIEELKNKLKEIKADLCFFTDFPEESEEFEEENERINILQKVEEIEKEINSIIENFSLYKVFREGATVVLVGPVNAGKSSLFNEIVGKKRAIVTEIPGTTRDYIEEMITLDGVTVKIIDTAGIRKTEDRIELEGVKQGKELIKDADVILVVLDINDEVSEEILGLLKSIPKDKSLIVLNKIDLKLNPKIFKLINELGFEFVKISVKEKRGIEDLLQKLKDKILKDVPEPKEGEIVPNLRQTQILKKALKEIREFKEKSDKMPIDVISIHLDKASEILSEITGEIYTEDILDTVFSKFCIGK